MASNTTNGPAGATGPAMPVKDHQTFNKKDKSQKDGFGGDAAPGSNTSFTPDSGAVNNGGS